MATSNQLSPGMTISLKGKLYRVESAVKVNVPKGTPFLKAILRDLITNEMTEKSFKLDQPIKDVSLIERKLEYLYPEGKDYLFLDIGNYEKVMIPGTIITSQIDFLKEGVDVLASFYGDTIFSIELPQFLELMVSKIVSDSEESVNGTKIAILETGAKIRVPLFIQVGDIIKIDTKTNEYVQRV